MLSTRVGFSSAFVNVNAKCFRIVQLIARIANKIQTSTDTVHHCVLWRANAVIAMDMRLITANKKWSGIVTCVFSWTQVCADRTFVDVDANVVVLASLMWLQGVVVNQLASKVANFIPTFTVASIGPNCIDTQTICCATGRRSHFTLIYIFTRLGGNVVFLCATLDNRCD